MNRLFERMLRKKPTVSAGRVARKEVAVRPKPEKPRIPEKSEMPDNPSKLFDVDIVYAEMTARTKNRETVYRGPYSPLYSAIYPLVCVTRVFGLAPYDFAGDRMTTSFLYLVFTLVFLCLYSYIMYIVFLRFISMKRDKSILSVVETTKVIVNYLTAMYELISNMFWCGWFVDIWNDLQDFDEKLRRLGYPRKEGSVEVGTWVLLVVQAVVWTLVNQSGMYAFMETYWFNMSYMCTYVGTAISVYKFSGMAVFVGQRFEQLNRITRDNLPPRVGYKSSVLSRKPKGRVAARTTASPRFASKSPPSLRIQPLDRRERGSVLLEEVVHARIPFLPDKTIQELHNEMMAIAESLASLYSWSLLFWLFNLSVHSVSNLYFIFEWLIFTLSIEAWPMILNMSLWLIGFSTQILAITASCDYAITEANSMGTILLEWDCRTVARFPNDDTMRTSLHFLIRRLRFSAGGLFDVDLLLLCSITGVLSTYLIILLQFPA